MHIAVRDREGAAQWMPRLGKGEPYVESGAGKLLQPSGRGSWRQSRTEMEGLGRGGERGWSDMKVEGMCLNWGMYAAGCCDGACIKTSEREVVQHTLAAVGMQISYSLSDVKQPSCKTYEQ